MSELEIIELNISKNFKQQLRRRANAKGLTLHDFIIETLRDSIKTPSFVPVNNDSPVDAVVLDGTTSAANDNDRQWERVIKFALKGIKDGCFDCPYLLEDVEDKFGVVHPCLLVRVVHIKSYLNSIHELEEVYCAGVRGMSVTALNTRIRSSSIFVRDGIERIINKKRVTRMVAFRVDRI